MMLAGELLARDGNVLGTYGGAPLSFIPYPVDCEQRREFLVWLLRVEILEMDLL